MNCTNHPAAPAAAPCAVCGRPFCVSCLVEFVGQWLCGPCRDQRLLAIQYESGAFPATRGAPFAGTGTVDIGRWLGAGWRIIQADLGSYIVATILLLLCSSAVGVLAMPLRCGFLMIAFHTIAGRRPQVGDMFSGFRRFLWAFLASFVIVPLVLLALLVISIPAAIGFAIWRDNTVMNALAVIYAVIAVIVVTLVLTGAIFFVFPDIAARNVDPINALRRSWMVVRRNPVMFIVAALVFDLVAVSGALACVVGILITFPLAEAARAQAYADHFGIDGWERTAPEPLPV